jgi:hypothetical protein
MSEKLEGGVPPQETPEKKQTQDAVRNLQDNLEFYLSNLWGYQDRPEEILAIAKKQKITLDLDTAVKQGLIKTLSEPNAEAPENLNLIIAFAKEHHIDVDLTQPDIQKAIENCYATLLSKTETPKVAILQEFVDRYHLSIDKDYIFKQALLITLNKGDGRRANNLRSKIKKEGVNIDFSDFKIIEALKQGLITTLRDGYTEQVNRLINFVKQTNSILEVKESEFVEAAKEGLKKCLLNMRLGPGGVTLAEQMIKLIRNYELPIDLQSAEVVTACREALKTAKESHSRFPGELQMFSARPHIEDFLKKYGIKID